MNISHTTVCNQGGGPYFTYKENRTVKYTEVPVGVNSNPTVNNKGYYLDVSATHNAAQAQIRGGYSAFCVAEGFSRTEFTLGYKGVGGASPNGTLSGLTGGRAGDVAKNWTNSIAANGSSGDTDFYDVILWQDEGTPIYDWELARALTSGNSDPTNGNDILINITIL